MDIRPIKNDADHAAALKEIERLWGAKAGSADGDKLDVLATLVEAYENTHWPIEYPEPIPYLKAIMEMKGLTQVDLATLLGSRARASEVLGKKRYLSKAMITKIAEEWKVTMDPLLKHYELINEKTKAKPKTKSKTRAAIRRTRSSKATRQTRRVARRKAA